ncbi:uncharacterized protein LOC130906042 isoform X2 [Corythoichthys intestinalis]|nr:uncharacterized protein LOC130906042 isoform X2 [Corythoichthys intestinalis]
MEIEDLVHIKVEEEEFVHINEEQEHFITVGNSHIEEQCQHPPFKKEDEDTPCVKEEVEFVKLTGVRKYLDSEQQESAGIKEEVEFPQIKQEEPAPPKQQKREEQLPIIKAEQVMPYIDEGASVVSRGAKPLSSRTPSTDFIASPSGNTEWTIEPYSFEPELEWTIEPYSFEPESDPEAEESIEFEEDRLSQDAIEWCRCQKCVKMPTEPENVCCIEINEVKKRMQELPVPPMCMTDHPGFEPVCLNVFSLQNVCNIFNADYGRLKLQGLEHRYRYMAKRSFVSWCWGYLGRNIRVVLPSCVAHRITEEFPDTQGNYVGFRPPLD